MGSLCDEWPDDPHCLWALCSHPCCWETEQRITKVVHCRTGRKHTKHCIPVNESFPSLTVVNVWEGACSRGHSEGKLLLPQKKTLQSFKSADPFISSVYPALQPTAAKEKGIQFNTPHISPDLTGSELPLGSTSLVLWIPNPHYIPQCLTQKRSKLPQCAVKELTCLPACPIQKAFKEKNKPKIVKKKVSFHQACSSLNNAGMIFSCQPDVASNRSPSGEEQRIDIRERSTEQPSETTMNRVSQKEKKKSPLMLRTRPVVLHTMQERAVKRVTMDALTSPYKLDSKTCGESIEWDSLMQQAYLWKRHNPLQHKDCSVSAYPPGGANVLLVDSDLSPVSSVRPHHPLQSPLSVAPVAWHCTKGIWSNQKSRRLPLSRSKHLRHSTASEADTLSTGCSSSTVMDHRFPDTDEKIVREKGTKSIITPINVLLPCQQLKQGLQDNASERSVVHVIHNFPEKSKYSSNSRRSFISGTEESWKENVSTEKGPEPKGYQACTPPPSLSSL